MKSNSKSKKPSFIPRSILKTIGKLNQTLDPDAESKVLQEFRASRQKTIIYIRFLLIVFIIPLLVSQLSKTFIINPLINQFWNQEQSKAFLNSSQEEKALDELERFQQEICFKALLEKTPALSKEVVEQKVKDKAIALTQEYKKECLLYAKRHQFFHFPGLYSFFKWNRINRNRRHNIIFCNFYQKFHSDFIDLPSIAFFRNN